MCMCVKIFTEFKRVYFTKKLLEISNLGNYIFDFVQCYDIFRKGGISVFKYAI